MIVNRYFRIGNFGLAIEYDSNNNVFGIIANYPLFSIKYHGWDVQYTHYHSCDAPRDDDGYCVHYPYNYKNGVFARDIIKAFDDGGYELVHKEFAK